MTAPDNDGGYPYPLMFGGDLPAYGAFLRYAEDIEFVDVRFAGAEAEARPPIVSLATKDIVLRSVKADDKPLAATDIVEMTP